MLGEIAPNGAEIVIAIEELPNGNQQRFFFVREALDQRITLRDVHGFCAASILCHGCREPFGIGAWFAGCSGGDTGQLCGRFTVWLCYGPPGGQLKKPTLYCASSISVIITSFNE